MQRTQQSNKLARWQRLLTVPTRQPRTSYFMRYSLALARLRPSARIYWRSADFPLSTCIANDNDSRRPRSPYPAETRGECRNRVSVWVDNLLIVPRRLPPPFLPHGLSFPRGSLAPGSFAAPVSGGHVATPTPDDRLEALPTLCPLAFPISTAGTVENSLWSPVSQHRGDRRDISSVMKPLFATSKHPSTTYY